MLGMYCLETVSCVAGLRGLRFVPPCYHLTSAHQHHETWWADFPRDAWDTTGDDGTDDTLDSGASGPSMAPLLFDGAIRIEDTTLAAVLTSALLV